MIQNNGRQPAQMFIHPRRKDRAIVARAFNHFDGFQVGATAPASTIQFVADVGKPFFIDPMAYYFMLHPKQVINPDDQQVRPTVLHLAERYGKLLADAIGRRVITAEELLAQLDALEALTANVLDYQRRRFTEGDANLFNPYYDKYAAFEAAGDPVPHVNTAQDPWVLIPPFFNFNSTEDSWYAATLRCARIGARERQPGEKIFATIFCGPALLSAPEEVEQVIEDFSQSELDGYFIWVNGLPEEKVSYRRLATLARFIEGLSTRTGKPVYKLYGGFLSIMLTGWGLSGFSCDLSYKTHRDVFRYGWAPPQPEPRFYIPRLHRSYPLEEAEHLLRQFPILGCVCDLCGEAYGKNVGRFSTAMSQAGHCEAHFLNVRRREIGNAARFGLPSCLKDLKETVTRLATGDAEISSHLKVWIHLLSELRTEHPQPMAPKESSKLSSESVPRLPGRG